MVITAWILLYPRTVNMGQKHIPLSRTNKLSKFIYPWNILNLDYPPSCTRLYTTNTFINIGISILEGGGGGIMGRLKDRWNRRVFPIYSSKNCVCKGRQLRTLWITEVFRFSKTRLTPYYIATYLLRTMPGFICILSTRSLSFIWSSRSPSTLQSSNFSVYSLNPTCNIYIYI